MFTGGSPVQLNLFKISFGKCLNWNHKGDAVSLPLISQSDTGVGLCRGQLSFLMLHLQTLLILAQAVRSSSALQVYRMLLCLHVFLCVHYTCCVI